MTLTHLPGDGRGEVVLAVMADRNVLIYLEEPWYQIIHLGDLTILGRVVTGHCSITGDPSRNIRGGHPEALSGPVFRPQHRLSSIVY